MNKLYEKLHKESDHVRLTHAEKNAMRLALREAMASSGSLLAQPAPRKQAFMQSPYLFISQRWSGTLAAVMLVVFVGGGTAFASEGALPGQPLYSLKTQVVEPVRVALASGVAAKAAVHAQIAATRVAEAEVLAERGTLDATTSSQLADNFEMHTRSAVALADEASTTDPAASAEVKARVAVNSSVGGAVLAALGEQDGKDNVHADAFAARVLALATTEREQDASRSARATKAAATVAMEPRPQVHAMAMISSGVLEASSTEPAEVAPEHVAALVPGDSRLAAQLQTKAQAALDGAIAQFSLASSTLDASTTVNVQNTIAGIRALIADGAAAQNSSTFDTATKDFTQALSRSLRLSALLTAQQKFDNHIIDLLFKSDSTGNTEGSTGETLPAN